MSAWRAVNTGLMNGPANMAIDETLLRGVAEGTSPPTIRVFGWSPPTVSVGHSQNLDRELDLEACRRAGEGVVRRPTGGRAVLHSGELTYSVAGGGVQEGLGRTVMETYLLIARALVRGLGKLGVPAQLSTGSGSARPRGQVATPPCFASAGRYEVVVSGRKVIGSAQRRMGEAVLQHGSLLLDRSHVEIADLMRIPERRRADVRKALEEGTTDLTSLIGRTPTFEETAAAILSGFEDEWEVSLVHESLTREERELAGRLASEYVV